MPERLELFATELPGAEHVAFGIDSLDGTAGDVDGLVRAGFEVSRHRAPAAAAPARPGRVEAGEIRPRSTAIARDDERLGDGAEWSSTSRASLRTTST